MIEVFEVANFKSIKHIEINCKRINVFIGHPNTGKSNILEALALLNWTAASYPHSKESLSKYLRIKQIHDMFYDYLLDHPISIHTKGIKLEIKSDGENFSLIHDGVTNNFDDNIKGIVRYSNQTKLDEFISKINKIKFYRYNKNTEFNKHGKKFLNTPLGENLFSLILHNSKIKDYVEELIEDFNFKLIRQPQETKVLFQKENLVQFDFNLVSDTLKSLIFYATAILTNSEAIILLEEPEEKNFPFYSKQIAELIINSDSQYFIVTHNPYFLRTIIEKSKEQEIQINITYLKNQNTQIKQLDSDEVRKLIEADPFFNIEQVVEDLN